MSKVTQFPVIPQDVHSKAMLANLTGVGVSLMNAGRDDVEGMIYQHGILLYTFATVPHQHPYLYYRLYEVFHPLYEKWQPIYNKMIAGMSQEKKLAVVEKNLPKEILDHHLMNIQLAIMPIQQRGANEEIVSPLSHLLWCYVFTWFDPFKWTVMMREFKGLLEMIQKETPEEQNQKELEKMIQAGVVKPTAQA